MEFDFDEEENPMRLKSEKPINTKNKLAEYAEQNEQQLESSVNITDQNGIIRGTIAGNENRSYSKMDGAEMPWNHKDEIS